MEIKGDPWRDNRQHNRCFNKAINFFGIRGQQAASYRGQNALIQQDTVPEAQSNILSDVVTIAKTGTESSGDELFYFGIQIPLLIYIGATSFCEGDMDNANQLLPCQQQLERRTRQPPEQQAERRAREPLDKCSTPSS